MQQPRIRQRNNGACASMYGEGSVVYTLYHTPIVHLRAFGRFYGVTLGEGAISSSGSNDLCRRHKTCAKHKLCIISSQTPPSYICEFGIGQIQEPRGWSWKKGAIQQSIIYYIQESRHYTPCSPKKRRISANSNSQQTAAVEKLNAVKKNITWKESPERRIRHT